MTKVEIGSATLYHADSLEVLPLLSDISAVVTDPPYSSGGMVRGDRMSTTRTKYQSSDVIIEHPEFSGDNRDQRSFGYWVALWLSAALRATKPSGFCCLFTDWRQLPSVTDSLQAGGWVWRGIAVWDKGNARPMAGRFTAQAEYIIWGTSGGHNPDKKTAIYLPGVFQIPVPPMTEREHSTQKPTQLLEEIVKVAPFGETVLDPFMGSGTTGVACINLGRKFVGVEIERKYFDIACERIAAANRQERLFADLDAGANGIRQSDLLA